MDNNSAIKTLTLYGKSLKKLYKYLPEDRIKILPNNGLEVNISGILFSGTDDNSSITISSSDRKYSKGDVIALQKIATKCYTYPFGDIGFTFLLNKSDSGEGEKALQELLIKHRIEHSTASQDQEGRTELVVSDVKDFSKLSFIDFVLELQRSTN